MDNNKRKNFNNRNTDINQKKGIDNFKVVFTTKVNKEKQVKDKDPKELNKPKINTSKNPDKNFNDYKKKNRGPHHQHINHPPKPIAHKRGQFQRTIIPYHLNFIDKKTCPKCNKIIEDMSSAIKDPKEESENYYHFDCVLKDIKRLNFLKPSERCVYLGSGIFGIIHDVKNESGAKFEIKKKIDLNNNPVV